MFQWRQQPQAEEAARSGLERFVSAQNSGAGHGVPFATALAELQAGAKQTHWVWYCFPQFIDRGGSMNETYQIHDPAEAVEFLRHEVLGARYLELAGAGLTALQAGATAQQVMGTTIDAKKFHQSVSLFWLAADHVALQPAAQQLGETLDRIATPPVGGGKHWRPAARVDPMTAKRWAAEAPPRPAAASAAAAAAAQPEPEPASLPEPQL